MLGGILADAGGAGGRPDVPSFATNVTVPPLDGVTHPLKREASKLSTKLATEAASPKKAGEFATQSSIPSTVPLIGRKFTDVALVF